MPRGNDPTAAAELADRYGAGSGNAEALIEANAARFSQELVAAQLLGVDEDASKELDYSGLAKAADLPDDAVVLNAKVRRGAGDPGGGYVVFVYESAGRVGKSCLVREDGKVLDADTSIRSSADVHRASVQADVTARQKAAAAIAEAEAQAQKAKDEALAEAQKTIEQAQEEAAKIKADAAAEAEKAQEKAAKGKGAKDAG